MNHLFEFFNSISPLEPAVQEDIRVLSSRIEVKKGDFLLKEGQVIKKIYWVEKGAFRIFYYRDDKEVNNWFVFENEILTSAYSLMSAQPACENIQALEDARLICFNKADMEQLFKKYHSFSEFGRKLMEKYYIELEHRVNLFLFRSAKERYDYLINTCPQILQRIPLGQIASFLGISPETLSRIRDKRHK